MYVRLVGYSRIRILILQIKWHAHMTLALSFEKEKKEVALFIAGWTQSGP